MSYLLKDERMFILFVYGESCCFAGHGFLLLLDMSCLFSALVLFIYVFCLSLNICCAYTELEAKNQ